MSQPIPAAFKPVASFITKGYQMEKADRVVAYYCFVWAVQSLLEKELHKKGKEEMNYAVQLMEHLEEVQNRSSKSPKWLMSCFDRCSNDL